MPSLRSFVLPVYAPSFLIATSVFAVLPGLPAHLGSIGAPVALTGTVVALRGVGTLITDLPAGMLLARVGARRIMIIAASTLCAAYLMLALFPLLLPTAAGVLFTGACTAAFFLGVQSHIRSRIESARRGRALSSTGGSLRIGAFAGPALGGAVAGRLGMEWTFGLSLVLATAALLLVLFRLHDERGGGRGLPRRRARGGRARRGHDLPGGEARPGGRASEASGLRRSFGVYRRLLSRPVPGMYVIGAAIVALMMLRATREFALPLWGGHIGLGVETIGYVMSAGALFDLLLFVPAGIVMDRLGRKAAASLCLGLFSVCLALLPLTGSLVGFAVVAAGIGAANGLGAGVNMTLGSDLAPDEDSDHFLGLWRLFGDVGATLGPNIVGAVGALLALPLAIGAVAAVGFLGTGVMVVLAPETGSPTYRRAPRPN